MKRNDPAVRAASVLTAAEAEAAAAVSVWVVWWEDPDKSWEALCLSQAEAEREFAWRDADSLLRSWGKVGRSDRKSLLEWLDGHLQAVQADGSGEYVDAAREILGKAAAGGAGAVVLRTW